MNAMVQDFLKRKQAEKRLETEEKKNRLAEKLGLYDIFYSPDNRQSGEYPEKEYDERSGRTYYYRKELIVLSDEEYEELLSYLPEEKNVPSSCRLMPVLFGLAAALLLLAGAGMLLTKAFWKNRKT